MEGLTITREFGPWDIRNAIRFVPDANNRMEMAEMYADAIRGGLADNPAECRKLNLAIIDRWSKSGLLHIKDKAWKILRSATKREPTPVGGETT